MTFWKCFLYFLKNQFTIKMRNLDQITCPICNEIFMESEYLSEVFKDDTKTKFISNLVTHYRHSHISYWNRCWGRNGDRYRGHWFKDYDFEKAKVNNRAKRQIIRKAGSVLKTMGIGPRHFKRLQETDVKTMDLALKVLGQD